VSDPTSVVSACLWDLQAQCEEQLRCFRAAQRLLQSTLPPQQRRVQIQAQLEYVARAAAQVVAGVDECMGHVDQLPDDR
jgi:hypothetical protein